MSKNETVDKPIDHHEYSATCVVQGQKITEEGFQLLSVEEDIYKIKAKDGKTLGLPQNSCFIVRNKNAESDEFSPIQVWGSPRFVTCELGEVLFASSPFFIIGDEKNYFKTMRVKDNAVFYYPRLNCSIRPVTAFSN